MLSIAEEYSKISSFKFYYDMEISDTSNLSYVHAVK